MTFYVYKHTRLDNNTPFYIGKGLKYRAESTKNRNKHWNNIVNKVGYKVEYVASNISNEEACELEIQLINKYGRKDIKTGCLVNMTDGGEGTLNKVYNPTEESIAKMKKTKRDNEPYFYAYNPNGELVYEGNSQIECNRLLFGLDGNGHISKVLKKQRKTYKKHKFIYKEI